MIYIFIDGSYFVFYRFHALLKYWRNAKADDLAAMTNPFDSEEFKQKYIQMVYRSLDDIPKKFKLKNKEFKVFLAQDCPRKLIWRNNLLPEKSYKGKRVNNQHIGNFFNMLKEKQIFEQYNNYKLHLLHHDSLEADDLIAISIQHIIKDFEKIYILSQDMDYTQLLHENIFLVNLRFKHVITDRNSTGIPEKDLFIKCVTGDKSDNIPGVFKKCGKKTAEKYYDNQELFKQKLTLENREDQYKLNRLLIDFTNIPEELRDSFIETYNELFTL